MRTLSSAATAMLALTAFVGCTQAVGNAEEDQVVRTSAPLVISADVKVDVLGFLQNVLGRGLNGTSIDGHTLEGKHVTHVLYEGAERSGEELYNVTLEETVFDARSAKGKRVSRAQFEGVTFRSALSDGSSLRLRVDSLLRAPPKEGAGIFRYRVAYETSEGWQSLCGVDEAGEAIAAIPLGGRWNYEVGAPGGGAWIDDPASFTFACNGHVAAKCVDMGYAPWRAARVCEHGQGCHVASLGMLHQACTRMLRSDYCGDGTSYTVNGQEVNVFDGFGIRIDSEDWETEAEWTTQGARCITRRRVESMPVPPCFEQLLRPDCGDPAHLPNDADLISEVPPNET